MDRHRTLSAGQRAYDVDLARERVGAELLDLRFGGLLPDGIDPIEVAESLAPRYEALWNEVTHEEVFSSDEQHWRVAERLQRLNDLGFDIGELAISTDVGGAVVRLQPKVVDAGHHRRRLQGLTGLDVEENQARRLLNDLNAFSAHHDLQNADPAVVAHRWLTEVLEPIVAMAPAHRRTPLESAELFHEILEHRWYLSERAGSEVDLFETARDYFASRDDLAASLTELREVVDLPDAAVRPTPPG